MQVISWEIERWLSCLPGKIEYYVKTLVFQQQLIFNKEIIL